MEKLPKVVVIMSTYNGEKYLDVQIESILAQKDVDLTLHIYDDVSKDKTVNIAKEYAEKYNNVFVHVNEKNKNFTYNFLDALFSFKDNQEYDYYAFADQDDYWLDDKLITGIRQIQGKGKCTLYCSNLKVVNENLEYDGKNITKLKYVNKHYDEVCRNVVTGCTIIMDNEFKNLATKHYPENIYCHDYWLGILANYCKDANFICDVNSSCILYRQHDNNLIGFKKKSGFVAKLKSLFRKIDWSKSVYNLIDVFSCLYKSEIKQEDIKILENLANINKFKSKIWLFFNTSGKLPLKFRIKMFIRRYKREKKL